MTKHRDAFFHYITYYGSGKERETPLNPRTLGRYIRGFRLAQRIVGHDLETVTERDQLKFIEGIKPYAQGTRRVSTQIFQRYIAWGRREALFDCQNIPLSREKIIVGKDTKPKYVHLSNSRVKKFFTKLRTPHFRVLFGLIYYGGLTTAEVGYITNENIIDSGLFVYRDVRKESQILPLPPKLLAEIRQFAEDKEGPILGIEDSMRGRFEISAQYKAATIETGELIGTSVRDLRTSGIRHFFELSQDLELTKQYAGVPDSKKGWLDGLVDVSSHYMKNIANARSYHGKNS